MEFQKVFRQRSRSSPSATGGMFAGKSVCPANYYVSYKWNVDPKYWTQGILFYVAWKIFFLAFFRIYYSSVTSVSIGIMVEMTGSISIRCMYMVELSVGRSQCSLLSQATIYNYIYLSSFVNPNFLLLIYRYELWSYYKSMVCDKRHNWKHF